MLRQLFDRTALLTAFVLALTVGVSGTLLFAPVLLVGTAAARYQPAFDTPEAAADALVGAVERRNSAAVSSVLGTDSVKFAHQHSIGERDVMHFLDAWEQAHQIITAPAVSGHYTGQHAWLVVGTARGADQLTAHHTARGPAQGAPGHTVQGAIRGTDRGTAAVSAPWTLPVPLVHAADGWRFDPSAAPASIPPGPA